MGIFYLGAIFDQSTLTLELHVRDLQTGRATFLSAYRSNEAADLWADGGRFQAEC